MFYIIDEKKKIITFVRVLYKKRSEAEIRQKFIDSSGQLLDEVIDELKENGYIDDEIYIEKAISEYQRLKNMSIRELEYKLLSKGIEKYVLDKYIDKAMEEAAYKTMCEYADSMF